MSAGSIRGGVLLDARSILQKPGDWKKFEARFKKEAEALQLWDKINPDGASRAPFCPEPVVPGASDDFAKDLEEAIGHPWASYHRFKTWRDQRSIWHDFHVELEHFKYEQADIAELLEWLGYRVATGYMRILLNRYCCIADLFTRLRTICAKGILPTDDESLKEAAAVFIACTTCNSCGCEYKPMCPDCRAEAMEAQETEEAQDVEEVSEHQELQDVEDVQTDRQKSQGVEETCDIQNVRKTHENQVAQESQ